MIPSLPTIVPRNVLFNNAIPVHHASKVKNEQGEQVIDLAIVGGLDKLTAVAAIMVATNPSIHVGEAVGKAYDVIRESHDFGVKLTREGK